MKKGKFRKGNTDVWRKPRRFLWVAVRKGGFIFLSPCKYDDDAMTNPSKGSS